MIENSILLLEGVKRELLLSTAKGNNNECSKLNKALMYINKSLEELNR